MTLSLSPNINNCYVPFIPKLFQLSKSGEKN